jgi:Ca-activated chloride channel family protein
MSPARLLGLTLSVCTLWPAAAARAASGAPPPFVTEGSLVASRGGQVVKVPLKHTRVRLRVAGYLAEATVTQVFESTLPEKIEAVYVFPLPTDAAVRGFSLRNDGRVVRGRLVLRGEAREIFRKASAAGRVAALLEQERPNVFTQTVANLEPRKRVEVALRYTSRLRYDSGSYELVFPMVVGPRFVPASERGGRTTLLSPPTLPPALRSAHDIDLALELDAGVAVDGLVSPSHRVQIARGSPATATVRLDRADRIPNKDFVLRYRVAGALPRVAAVAAGPAGGGRGRGGSGHLLLMVQPPDAASAPAPVARELIFVLDTSSSMTGAPLAQAKALVRRLLGGLGADDTFQIVRFDERTQTLGPRMIARSPENVRLAGQWLERLRAGGGTLVERGLEAALALPHDPARLRLAVFLSDGYVGNEDAVQALVGRRLGAARLFAFGVGTAVNRYLLEELAALGRGELQVLRPDEPAAPAVERFYRRLERPLLTDITIEVRGLALKDLAPARIPDLFAGQPLVVHARYERAGRGVAIVRGQRAGRAVRIEVPLTLPRAGGPEAVAYAWARAQIAEAERRLLRRDDATTRRRIIELALEHGLLTRYTAFVAVDEESRTAGGKAQRVVVAVERPQAMLRAIAAGGGGSAGIGGLVGNSIGHGYGGGGTGSGTIGLGTLSAIKGAVHVSGNMITAYKAAPVAQTVAPRVAVGTPIITGSLDKELLRRVVRRHLNEVRYCYELGLQGKPTLAGRVELKFTVVESGAVASSQIGSSTLGAAAVESCIAAAARRWMFPKVEGGGLVVVSYPFVLRPKAAGRPSVLIDPHER